MYMKESEKQEIMRHAKFLEGMGYECSCDEYGVGYFDGRIRIRFHYERIGSLYDVYFRFVRENRIFSIVFYAQFLGGEEINSSDPPESFLRIIRYIRKDYERLKYIEHCEECKGLCYENTINAWKRKAREGKENGMEEMVTIGEKEKRELLKHTEFLKWKGYECINDR